MASKKNVLICDDNYDASKDWATKLAEALGPRSNFVITPIEPNKLVEQVLKLTMRRKDARSRKSWSENCDFDNVDVLVIDYDLQDKDPRSGREIAFLARCFSTCGLIVSLNELGPNPFDLTLTAFADSFADLNIGSSQLANSGLWKQPWKGFRPWSWPLIPKALADFETRTQSLVGNLDKPILEHLGLDNFASHLSRPIVEFLSSAKKSDVRKITFRDFVTNSPNGLKFRDRESAMDDAAICRIAAARVSHWLERIVLPGQHILVDAPHLVSRLPSLLTKSKNESTLNKTTSMIVEKMGVDESRIANEKFQKAGWLSRDAWFWPSVSTNESIAEVSDPWSLNSLSYVFCEDVSAFLPIAEAREFVADVASPFVRRYLVDITCKTSQHGDLVQDIIDQEVQFLPNARLAL